MTLEEMVEAVEALVEYPEVEGETYLADWIAEGDWQNMTPEEIAAEWDDLSRQAKTDKE